MEPSTLTPRPRRWTRVLWVLTLVHVALFASGLVPAHWVEAIHARLLFPAVRAVLATPAAAFPFSVAELAIVALALVVPAILVLAAFGPAPATDGGRRGALGRACRRLLVGAAVLANLYLLGFGWSYQRPPLAERMGMAPVPGSERFAEVAREVADLTRLARTALPQDPDFTALGLQARLDLDRVLAELDGPAALPVTRLKPCWPVGMLQTFGVSGIFSPFTQECHVDPALDPLVLPFTACHELAHLAGLGPEDEASFAGFVACLRSPDPWFRYSGLVLALVRFERQAPMALREELQERAGPGVLEDRRRADERSHRRQNVTLTRIAWKTYDGILQAQGVAAGVRSYDHMTRLVLSWWPSHDR
ncbi:MAG: DUF3810 family protein [Planctomycetota bacterium]